MGAINLDIIAEQGVKGSAIQLPFKSGIVDEIVISNPFIPKGSGMIDFLPEASRVLKQDCRIIINFTKRNKFGKKIPNAEILESLGLKIIQKGAPLDLIFSEHVFRLTDGRVIPHDAMLTTIFEKVK